MCAKGDDAAKLEAVLSSSFVKDVIEEAVSNWTQNWDTIDSQLSSLFESYARDAASKIIGAALPSPDFNTDWKRAIANKVEEALNLEAFAQQAAPAFTDFLREMKGDPVFMLGGLHLYSLMKIASHSGSVSFMISHGLDPELLRMTDAESNEQMRRRMEELQKNAPESVIMVDLSQETSQDILDEIRLRTDPPDVSDLIR